jgi:outer membrane biosynthesis protein TonB
MARSTSSNLSFLIPFAIALAVHGGLIVASMTIAEYSAGPQDAASQDVVTDSARIVSSESPPPLVVAMPEVTPPALEEFRIGAEDGSGKSLQDAPSDRLNAAKLADAEQPLTRVEPKMPSSSADASAEPGDGQVEQSAVVPQLAGASRSMFDRVPLAKMPGKVIEPQDQSQPGAPVEIAGQSEQRAESPAAPRDDAKDDGQKDAEARTETHAGAPSDAATAKPSPARSPEELDPAMFANNDMDAFSMESGLTMQPGGTKVRKGRPIDKLRQPRIDLAFQADARAIRGTIGVVYVIAIDETGKPRDVSVKQSSGSVTIDEAWRRALLETTFGGKRPDTFTFGVAIVVD